MIGTDHTIEAMVYPTTCPTCAGPLVPSPGLASGTANRQTEGACFIGPGGIECARERTVSRDADGNIAHDRVAPATKLAFVGGPRVSRRAR